MKKQKSIYCLIIFSFVLLMTGCKEEEVDFNANNCKGAAPFIKKLGFDQKRSFFSTSDKRKMGLVLQEIRNSSDSPKSYQHPSWTKGGWLAPIQIDNIGNIFLGPAPFVNVLNNSTYQQNTLYKVDATTGVMDIFLQLPSSDSPSVNNPYGILGLAFLCEPNVLYASSVAGSTRAKESGTIFAIDPVEKKIIDKIEGIDAFGMGVSFIEGKRKLYFGSARTSDVYGVVLDKEGKFSGKPEKVFSLQNLGERGDDKVRKIRSDNYGNLIVSCIEFSYNLRASTEKKEAVYEFLYSDETKKWSFSKELLNGK